MKWPLEEFSQKDVVFVGKGQGRSMQGFEAFVTEYGNIRSFKGVDKGDVPNALSLLSGFDPIETIFVKNEGIPGQEMPVPYVTPINIFFSCVKKLGARTVGITGTKGKSTTTSLVASIVKAGGFDARLGGNIGTSVFEGLKSATRDSVFVIELSSYQLSDIKYSPNISACLNLYNDHADWHGSLEKYWEAKHNIMLFADQNDTFVYNPDFPTLQEWASTAVCQTTAIDPEESYDLSNSQLYGDHNILNVLIAQAIARTLGIKDTVIQEAINNFKPLEHRMEYVTQQDGKIYINDAIGMTPESTLASLKAIYEKYGKIGCLFLGGKDRGYDFKTLMQAVAAANVPELVLFPDTAEKMKRCLPPGYEPNIFETRDMNEAVAYAKQNAPGQSVVLLSTAAPSYSIWRNFEEKGRLFKEAVLRI